MKLMVNEWRKFLKRRVLLLTIPILTLLTIVGCCLIVRLYIPKEIVKSNDLFIGLLKINLYLLMTMAIVYASSILTQELTSGTIKLLLTRPYNRHKVLLAKFGALTILMTATMFAFSIISYIVELIIYGSVPNITFCLKQSGINIFAFLISVMYFGAFALLVSTLINSPSMSTAFTLIFFMGGHTIWTVITSFLKISEDNLLLYKIFPLQINDNLLQLLDMSIENSNGFVPSELFIALITTLVYTLIFYLIADFIFNRKDISLAS